MGAKKRVTRVKMKIDSGVGSVQGNLILGGWYDGRRSYLWLAKMVAVNEELLSTVKDYAEWAGEFEELCTEEDVENYLKQLTWADDTPDIHKTLVKGNIRGFFYWLVNLKGH